MAVKKGGKSSKTAHILNVLSSDPSEMMGEAAEGRTEAAGADFSPVSDEALATAIRESLAEDIRREEGGAQTPPPEGPPAPEEASRTLTAESPAGGEAAAFSEAAPEEEETPEAPAEAEPADLTAPAAFAQQPAQVAEPSAEDREFCYVNVMETLVEEKAPKYIAMFGVCSCARCVADVKALALTNLSPKYAVMEKGQVIPMLTVYEGRFSAALTSQIISACKKVMLEPRH